MFEEVLHLAILCQPKRNKQDKLLQEEFEGVLLCIRLIEPQDSRNLPLLHLFWLASIRLGEIKSGRELLRLFWCFL